ncbi:arylsulfatase [Flavobacterium sp. ZS1P14]|uniref:arylsulfatase n=1 Tax=Flavobacterium sp. ZS1P14 TaxID=3401729 RepID=UPI003AACE6E5
MNKIRKIVLMCLVTAAVFGQQKPNVIYIYADDMGYGELGAYGQQKIKTPNLDRIAREGMKFTQHYAGAPVCAPSRCMLMTGKNSGHSYIRGNYELGGFEDENEGGQMPLPEGTFTIAKLMKEAGYVTGAIGKWGLGMNNTTGDPNKQGFDYFYGYLCQKQAHNFYPTHLWENGKWDTLKNPYIQVHKPLAKDAPDTAFDYFKGTAYSVTKMAEKTFDFIKKNRRKPFFLYLPYTGPHVSLQAPEAAVKEYLGQFEEHPYHGENGYAATLYPRATYAAMITYMDKQVGEIMKLLKELGLDENTIVMFSSDNGPTFNAGGADIDFFNSAGGLRGRKQDLYEGGIREPFIARWPGKIPAGKVSNHIAAQFDMMATLAEMTEVKAWDTDGISFLPTLLGKDNKQQQHDYLYFEFPEKGGQVAVRMGDWKGVKSTMKKNKKAAWEIYNLLMDEKETTDIAGQHLELAKKFEAIVKKEHQPSHIRDWEFIDPKFSEKE